MRLSTALTWEGLLVADPVGTTRRFYFERASEGTDGLFVVGMILGSNGFVVGIGFWIFGLEIDRG